MTKGWHTKLLSSHVSINIIYCSDYVAHINRSGLTLGSRARAEDEGPESMSPPLPLHQGQERGGLQSLQGGWCHWKPSDPVRADTSLKTTLFFSLLGGGGAMGRWAAPHVSYWLKLPHITTMCSRFRNSKINAFNCLSLGLKKKKTLGNVVIWLAQGHVTSFWPENWRASVV